MLAAGSVGVFAPRAPRAHVAVLRAVACGPAAPPPPLLHSRIASLPTPPLPHPPPQRTRVFLFPCSIPADVGTAYEDGASLDSTDHLRLLGEQDLPSVDDLASNKSGLSQPWPRLQCWLQVCLCCGWRRLKLSPVFGLTSSVCWAWFGAVRHM